MRKSILFFAFFALPTQLQATPYNYAENYSGFYVTSFGGVTVGTDKKTNSGGLTGNIKPDIGHIVSLAAGYEWRHMRFEVEYAYRSLNGTFSNTNVAALENTDADYRINSVLVNAFYDFYLSDSLFWYNGLGFGAAWVKLRAFGRNNRDTTFAWQIRSGAGYDITEHIALLLGYRLFSTTKANFNNLNVNTPYISSFEFGVRYNF